MLRPVAHSLLRRHSGRTEHAHDHHTDFHRTLHGLFARYKTTLSSRLGTKITFFGVPVMNLAMSALAIAAASTPASTASGATTTVPRVLPLTCTAIVTVSCVASD